MGQRLLAQTTLRPKAAHIPRQNVPERSLVSLFHKDDFGSITLLRRPLLSYIREPEREFAAKNYWVSRAKEVCVLKIIWTTGVIFLICFSARTAAWSQSIDPRTATEQLIREVQEDFARQRARARAREDAEDAAEIAQRNRLDFSQFGVPAERQPSRPAPSSGITCTTIGLGDGDSITNCH
jgi:hypothetical protein